MTDTLDTLAADLWKARLAGDVLDPARAAIVATPDDAYAVLGKQVEASGAVVVGWKLGATAAAALEAMGLEESFVAPLLDRFVHVGPATLPVFPDHLPKIETEFAVEIADDLPPRDAPYGRDEVVAATARIAGALEIVSSRFGPMVPKAGLRTIADGAFNRAVVVAATSIGWRETSPVGHKVTVTKNGAVAAADCTTAATLWPDPLEAVAWLASNPRARPRGLKAGDIVMTGTFAPLVDAAPGDHVVADFGPFGVVEATFSAATPEAG